MFDISQPWNLPDCGPVAPQLIRMDAVWNVVFPQQADQEGLCSFGIAVALKENVKHEAVLVYRAP